jgi:predicted RNase H-like HicB family nuclease
MSPTKTLPDYLSLRYPFAVEQREDGHYFVTHPNLDGCMAEGDSLAEALESLADAKELWIEARLSNGSSIPEPAAPDEEAFSGRNVPTMSGDEHS